MTEAGLGKQEIHPADCSQNGGVGWEGLLASTAQEHLTHLAYIEGTCYGHEDSAERGIAPLEMLPSWAASRPQKVKPCESPFPEHIRSPCSWYPLASHAKASCIEKASVVCQVEETKLPDSEQLQKRSIKASSMLVTED